MNVTVEKIEIVSFGMLKNAVIEAGDGINILEAPNESGKTTLASFIKFIFYGFAGARVQTVAGNEKKMYMPWDGEMSSGALNIICDGKKYRIERSVFASNKETVTITDRANGKAVFPGEDPGQKFFGVSEEIFSKTLFFRQLTHPSDKDEQLAEQLRNIAVSADEQISTKNALDRLKASRNELRVRTDGGLLPKFENERARLERAISDSEECAGTIESLIKEEEEKKALITEAQSKLALLENERKGIEKYDAYIRLKMIKELAEEEKAARESYEKSSEGFTDGGRGTLSKLFGTNTEYTAEKKNLEMIEKSLGDEKELLKATESALPFGAEEGYQAEHTIAQAKKLSAASAISALLLIAASVILWFATGSAASFLPAGLAVILLAVCAVFLARPAATAKSLGVGSAKELERLLALLPENAEKQEECRARISGLEAKRNDRTEKLQELKTALDAGIGEFIGVSGDADYDEQLNEILARSTENGELKAHWSAKKADLDRTLEGVDTEKLAEEARNAVKPVRDRTAVDNEIKFYSSRRDINSETLSKIRGQRASLEGRYGDPAVLVGKKNSFDTLIADGDRRYRALDTAMKLIDESSDYMKQMVAPRISERADEYFRIATDGKYSELGIDTKMSMYYGGDFRKSCDYLSAGTRDSAYLCLRLALADMLFGGSRVPVVLDDAFAHIDESRLRAMMRALGEASQRHQIFIFTHGEREKNALNDTGTESRDIVINRV